MKTLGDARKAATLKNAAPSSRATAGQPYFTSYRETCADGYVLGDGLTWRVELEDIRKIVREELRRKAYQSYCGR